MECYGDALGEPLHRSFFRQSLERRAASLRVPEGLDPVHEYLIDQANLRGLHGAYSSREDPGELDPALSIEEIIVGILQPHAPVEGRMVKLVVRALQSGRVDVDRLLFLSKRERALPILAWITELVPEEETTEPIECLRQRLRRDPPRNERRPRLAYSAARLVRR